jgi:hypothetical protein
VEFPAFSAAAGGVPQWVGNHRSGKERSRPALLRGSELDNGTADRRGWGRFTHGRTPSAGDSASGAKRREGRVTELKAIVNSTRAELSGSKAEQLKR